VVEEVPTRALGCLEINRVVSSSDWIKSEFKAGA